MKILRIWPKKFCEYPPCNISHISCNFKWVLSYIGLKGLIFLASGGSFLTRLLLVRDTDEEIRKQAEH